MGGQLELDVNPRYQRRISACSAEQGPQNKGALQARECRTVRQRFLECEGLYGMLRHLKIHLVQHDIHSLAHKNYKASEFRKPCLKSGNSSKAAYSCNAEFTVRFCALMSENLREMRARHFCGTGFYPAVSGMGPDGCLPTCHVNVMSWCSSQQQLQPSSKPPRRPIGCATL